MKDFTKLDMFFETLAEYNRFMGSVAVSQNGEIIYTKTVGYADIEQETKVNVDTKYRIGSVTKTYTATLVLLAIEEKKLSLNQTIDKFFPNFINANKITIEHLLYHRSGIPNFTNEDEYQKWYTHPKSEIELTDFISGLGSEFEPDTEARYSNSGYVLLTFILQKVYNKSYNELLQEKICKPLGLKNTYFGAKINIKNNECYSYKYQKGWQKELEEDMSLPQGGGAIVSNPTDIITFVDALFSGKIISENSLKQMLTLKDYMGMGIVYMGLMGKHCFGHAGGIDGFCSLYVRHPDNIILAYTANYLHFYSINIATTIFKAVLNQQIDIPEFIEYHITEGELDIYLGEYLCVEHSLNLIITKVDGLLKGQFTGQSPIPFEAIGKHKFEFVMDGIILEFNTDENALTFTQDGANIIFKKM